MSIFYLLNLVNTLFFTKQVALEHLPYEEGIKTNPVKNNTTMTLPLEHLPYEEGIKTALFSRLVVDISWNTYPMKRVLRQFLN